MKIKSKKILRVSVILITLLIITECGLRIFFGFCDAVLFRTDAEYEYIPIPQKCFRFGNHIFYNSLSQRNREISKQDSVIILGFGDSVLNGGALTDQDSLATTRLTKYLINKYHTSCLFTNISAQSWGPDNCYAYLKRNGNFGAKAMLLVVSSHDAYDDMNYMPVVGKNLNYPDKQYASAIYELIDRYALPRLFTKHVNTTQDLGINKRLANTPFNSGFKNFKRYSDSTGLPLVIYLHAEESELKAGKYNEQGMEIIHFCNEQNISLIKELDYHLPETVYRDNIHINNLGQLKMFEILKQYY
jgi:hypothetical protein